MPTESKSTLEHIVMNLILGLGALWISVILLALAFACFRFFWKRSRVRQTVANTDSGIYVRHGMTVDPETGLVSGHNSPSDTAWEKL